MPLSTIRQCLYDPGLADDRALPSLGALAGSWADSMSTSTILRGVQEDMTVQYTADHGHHQEASSGRGR